MATLTPSTALAPLVCIIDFHHARGPEVEAWIGLEDGEDPAVEHDWSLLPFMALSDGAHASTEDYSYFTLRRSATSTHAATSLFGISCTRQLPATELIDRPADVTRSTVQKAVVVITDSPQHFGAIKAQLGVVTAAWFAQRDFTDVEILQRFQESLPRLLENQEGQAEHYFGISLRELIHEFKWQTLVLFKCALLQRKDSADPKFNSAEEKIVMPTSLKTSERSSLLAYMGLPLQLFGKGSLFGPYTPLQQLDMLADADTKSYIVGSTNSLLLQQKDRYSDILINLDDHTVNTTSSSLRQASILSTPDRRWIDFLTQTVNDSWDESNPARPKDHGYAGSEEFIRMQFEEYLLAMLSSVKYKLYMEKHPSHEPLMPEVHGDPASEFSNEWVHGWMQTENFRIWNKYTDSHLFDIVDPKHPCSGGLSVEDVQRRLAAQVAELHLDERLEKSREVIGERVAAGQAKVSTAYNKLWADIEAMRKAQRERQEEQRAAAEKLRREQEAGGKTPEPANKWKTQGPDLTNARASAGAYFSSWGSWASEKRKGWGNRSASANQTPVSSPPPSAGPLPGDLKGAEEFQRDKGASLDGSTLYTPSTSSGHKRIASYDEETDGGQKDNGVFFDAEVAEKERNAWRTD
ncbi:late secretory pathway protein avl9 [Didymella keratinophila]|nr:late secretory pathway protein avl9 [Didymella keratinophila]